MKTRLAVLIASFGYAGFFPVAPGTAGSAAALVIYAVLRWAGASRVAEVAVMVAVALVGVWSASIAERHFAKADPGQVVIDEVLGMLMTLAFLPLSWTGVIVGFLVFRALDIVKPFPANVAERLPAGLGIMADDAMAGIYGNLLMRLAIYLVPAWM